MSNISQEDVATGLRTVQQNLEALRDEHGTVCTTLESSLKGISEDEAPMPREKHHQTSDNVTSISNGLEEVTMMTSTMSHLNNLEAEKQKYQPDEKDRNTMETKNVKGAEDIPLKKSFSESMIVKEKVTYKEKILGDRGLLN
ncbi:unnamed protein product [Cylicocyclus nassatus]|uniref:Uncharacterized protein n=1 Tax=Cylicocyclus nassatus TaxID=53992 RepID=A0AA36HGF6_CYLNA|nr:unnamed protein product [Cylicocyclus nassatus]